MYARILFLIFVAAKAASGQVLTTGASDPWFVPRDVGKVAVAQYRWHDGVALNDLRVTPGKIRTSDPADPVIAGKESTRKYRHTTPAMKATAFRLYGVNKNVVDRARFCTGIVVCDTDEQIAAEKKARGKEFSLYEVDHVCPLELGCADSILDLVPQPYFAHPGANEKDDLENVLADLVQKGRLLPVEAQNAILADWYVAYLKYVKHSGTQLEPPALLEAQNFWKEGNRL